MRSLGVPVPCWLPGVVVVGTKEKRYGCLGGHEICLSYLTQDCVIQIYVHFASFKKRVVFYVRLGRGVIIVTLCLASGWCAGVAPQACTKFVP